MTQTFDLDLCRAVGDSADRLVSTQIFMSGGSAELTTKNITRELYEAARGLHQAPLTYLAAKGLLERVEPRRSVVLCAGFFDPPSMIDEADGPVGAALLARALCIAFDATPVFLTEVANMGRMQQLSEAMGMEVVPHRLAKTTPFKASLFPLPIEPGRAAREADLLLDETDPAAVIAIEKPAPGTNGHYHTGVGLQVSDVVGKVDHVFNEARGRGIWTVGMGDGGNEVGMGNILPTVQDVIPTGKTIGATVQTDLLVVGAVANWASYAVEACLAAALHAPEVLHGSLEEARVQEAAARAGLIDPASGWATGWVDGTPPICSASMLELLRQMVELRLLRQRENSIVNFPKRWVARGAADETIAIWANELAEREAAYFGQ